MQSIEAYPLPVRERYLKHLDHPAHPAKACGGHAPIKDLHSGFSEGQIEKEQRGTAPVLHPAPCHPHPGGIHANSRRQNKRPANAKSKTNKGRFTSKYALSERLVWATMSALTAE